jgi:sulfoxide reductase catalytic subunit YedY
MQKIPSSEITPEHVYLARRKFMKTAVFAGTGAAVLAACGVQPGASTPGGTALAIQGAGPKDELGNPANTLDDITHFNNYYEFSTDKVAVSNLVSGFITSPWSIKVGGLVNNPGTYDIDDLRKKFDQQEHIYRLRCVEGWSMVIPWDGFSLAQLLKLVEPTSAAKFVRFETVFRPDQMPGQNDKYFAWPYVEGLRLDEAMNDLTLLATGLYGKPLETQNGAPIRLVVPWKYGFKSIKAIVKIDLVDTPPTSLWMSASPREYGFYANVNPDVPHPRWSQDTERRIGEIGRRPTLMFNGYDKQVASLYQNMDLRENF